MSLKHRINSSDDDEDNIKPISKKIKTKFASSFECTSKSDIKREEKTSTLRNRTAKLVNVQCMKSEIDSDEQVTESTSEDEESSDSDYAPEVNSKSKHEAVRRKNFVARRNVKKIKTEVKAEHVDVDFDKCINRKDFPHEDEIEFKPKTIKFDQPSTSNVILKSKSSASGLPSDSLPDSEKFTSIKKHDEELDWKKDDDTLRDEKTRKIRVDWEEAEVLAEDLCLDYHIARNIVRLLDEDNTIPFIARYRKEMTGNMPPEKLREVREGYETLKNVKKKAASIVKNVMKMGKLNPMLENEILSAKSMSELEHINASFKTSGKGTLADRARELGLETPALTLLCGNSVDPIRPAQFVCFQKTKGLATPKEVEVGMQHIIADFISKDRGVRDLVRKLKNDSTINLSCIKSKITCKANSEKNNTAESSKQAKRKASSLKSRATEDESKYQNYFNFKISTKLIKPHQVLAINRGEKNKILTVKVDIPQYVSNQLYNYVQNRWLYQGISYPLRYKLVEESFTDAYERLILPLIVRQVRSELTQIAENASVEVFASNLKNLLLQPPLRGKVVMGMDPGFRNGCKLAVISHTGNVLHTDVIYPNLGPKSIPVNQDTQAFKLKDFILTHRCETIALGNGTACRETEEYLSRLIKAGWFKPLDVVYTIVSEQGASIYSCSPEAHKEFPELDANLISAVSIARRLQDPLGEFVKVEARHLGVGMYQHDLPDSKLRSTLDEVVIECVSFVGVDLNVASQCILRRIAGLNATRAQNIIEWRNANGPFHNREQIKEVKGIGTKTFEQCAGFVRILYQTCGLKSMPVKQQCETKGVKKGKGLKMKENNYIWNPLDSTWIHPESYDVAERIIKKCDLSVEDIGSLRFIEKLKSMVKIIGIGPFALEMKVSEELIKLLTDGLSQPPDHDLRSEFSKPLFRRGVKSMEDLRSGDLLSGKVRNVTHFGAFVDIGVGRDGLLPSGRLRFGMSLPQLGDRVEVQIVEVDIQRRRITLDLVSIE